LPELPYTLLDVFTDTPLQGNPLAVVHDAGDLDDATMLAFARETRLSETSFVQPAGVDGADYRNRIFMMGGEIPFAGHPSLGTAVAEARRRGKASDTLVQQTGAGLQPIDLTLDGERATASMLQESAELGPELDPAEALAPAGLEESDADPELPPQVVSTGLPHVIAPVRDRDALARARPEHAAIGRLLDPHDALVLYLVASDASGGPIRARALLADPRTGEDPATGSAAGPLCVYLAERCGLASVDVEQGVEMGRPSRLAASIEHDRVRVGGDVVAVIDGTLRI
jgi:trans-2,3-dihydro-3-hydroxyanthranilate isomerase